MSRFILLLILMLTVTLSAGAQGKVTVTQSDDIDALVNGKKNQSTAKKKEPSQQAPSVKNESAGSETSSSSSHRQRTRYIVVKRPKRTTDEPRTHKRIYHGLKKAPGYRIQVFSGGNTRVARQKAEEAGQKVKTVLPKEPVYVHFYTPRWMCRVGNYVEYNTAKRALRKIRKLGYKNAIIIKTMITVRVADYM